MVQTLTGALDTHGAAGRGAIFHYHPAAEEHEFGGGGAEHQGKEQDDRETRGSE
jgi:hypothetical protein